MEAGMNNHRQSGSDDVEVDEADEYEYEEKVVVPDSLFWGIILCTLTLAGMVVLSSG